MTIETKYNIGDEVWFLHDNNIVSDKIDIIKIEYSENRFTRNKATILYVLKQTRKVNNSADFFTIIRQESDLSPSKADLLNSL